ncbi:Transposon Tf2-9 polyprotein [Anthophora retusa]
MEQYGEFTVPQLKDRLRELGQPTAGSKSELIARLMNVEPMEKSLTDTPADKQEPNYRGKYEQETEWMRREMEMARRERDMMQKELEIARREIEVMQRLQQLNVAAGSTQPATTGNVMQHAEIPHTPIFEGTHRTRASVTAIAELLSHYDGDGPYEYWERQFQLLREAHRLTDHEAMVLVGSRLRGKAMEWLHSRPEYVAMPTDDLLREMKTMFHHLPSKVARKREFEQRRWKHGERFSDYYHQKLILGNRVPVDEDEIIEHLLEGIPDMTMRNQARIERFKTKADLFAAFEKVVLPPAADTTRISKKAAGANGYLEKQRPRAADGQQQVIERCHNCGGKSHRAAECPMRDRGAKCFHCREFGHIASKCPRKTSAVVDSLFVETIAKGKYLKPVTINNSEMTALIDTGSDVTLMRADVYDKIGAPRLQYNQVCFDGIGSISNKTLGGFSTTIEIDGSSHPIMAHVVPESLMQYSLLLGIDFLNNVELTVKHGHVEIRRLSEAQPSENDLPEVLQIDLCEEINQIDISHIKDPQVKERVMSMVEDYEPKKEKREVGIEMSIVLKDEEPVYQRARRLSMLERDEVNMHIREWLRDGIVQPSLSDFASPVVLVRKKDGSSRLCVDYRQLNQKIIKDRYPLPLIDDQLDALQGAKFYSTLDLKNGFFHVAIKPEHRKYTSFIVPDGQYEFLKVPFGLCNSPALFQKFVNAVFRELINDKTVLTYLDDLIVPSVDVESGLENLHRVLQTASEAGLVINWKKCQLLQTKVEFLGHIVENQTVRPSERKTEAVAKFRKPVSTREVQSFLGLTGYFRKFISHYSLIARPLTDLLKSNEKFRFEDRHVLAFEQLKKALVDKPVLRLYKIGAETELHTDASKYGFGSILLQRDSIDGALHPVYYASGKTNVAESHYTSYELECLAIIKSLRKFRVYLLGIPFKIVTDCRAFALTMRKRDLCVRVARWALLLQEFQYTIEHRSGNSMRHVDALSRYPLPECMLISESDDSVNARLKRAQASDEKVRKLLQAVKEKPIDGYCVQGDLLFKVVDGDYKLVVPRSMQASIIRRAHEVGHFAVGKTESLVKRDYWFAHMKPKIDKVVGNCVNCILAERKHGKGEGFLHSVEKGETPLDTYHVDHLGPLVSTKKSYKHILLVIDGFTKFTWLYATRSTTTAEVIDKLRKQSVIFGNPRRIISDRGTAFTSGEFENYCAAERIKHVTITTGMPRSNGQAERINRVLIPILTKLAAPRPEEWYEGESNINETFVSERVNLKGASGRF